jgi:hypothetical protein
MKGASSDVLVIVWGFSLAQKSVNITTNDTRQKHNGTQIILKHSHFPVLKLLVLK